MPTGSFMPPCQPTEFKYHAEGALGSFFENVHCRRSSVPQTGLHPYQALPGAIEDFRRVIEPAGWVQPWKRFTLITAARRRHPRRVLELFAPVKLPGRIIRALKRNPPAW
jgi:hypothetical protein